MKPPILSARRTLPHHRGGKAAEPDGFMAFSYPGDTFALTEQAQIQGLRSGRSIPASALPSPASVTGSAMQPKASWASAASISTTPVADYFDRHEELTGRARLLGQRHDLCRPAGSGPGHRETGSLDRAAVIEPSRTAPSTPSSARSTSSTTSTRTCGRSASGVMASSSLLPPTASCGAEPVVKPAGNLLKRACRSATRDGRQAHSPPINHPARLRGPRTGSMIE